MAVLCSSTCCPTDNKPPVPFTICNNTKKKYNYAWLIAISCSYQFIDITSPAEWTAAKTAGDIQCFPKGLINVNPPTETIIDTDNDGGKTTVDGQYVIDYSLLFQADNADHTDETFFYNLKQKSGKYSIALLDGDGNFTLSQQYIDALAVPAVTVAGVQAGLAVSVTQTPHRVNENKYSTWKTQLTLDEGEVLRSVQLAGVPEVLCC